MLFRSEKLTKDSEITVEYEVRNNINTTKATNITVDVLAKEVKKEDKYAGNSGTAIKSSNPDFNTRAARGQALNLAVSVAIADGKHADDSYILGQVARFIVLGAQVQAGEFPVTKAAEAEAEVTALFE